MPGEAGRNRSSRIIRSRNAGIKDITKEKQLSLANSLLKAILFGGLFVYLLLLAVVLIFSIVYFKEGGWWLWAFIGLFSLYGIMMDWLLPKFIRRLK